MTLEQVALVSDQEIRRELAMCRLQQAADALDRHNAGCFAAVVADRLVQETHLRHPTDVFEAMFRRVKVLNGGRE